MKLKEAFEVLIQRYESGERTLHHGCGICREVRTLCDTLDMYELMSGMLNEDDYFRGLGPAGVFTEDRYHFLLLLDAMQEEDYVEFLNEQDE